MTYELPKNHIWDSRDGDTSLLPMLREVAEYPNSFIALGSGVERLETPRFTLCMERLASSNTVQRQRFAADQVDDVLGEVRSLLRARGRTRTQWEIGSAAEPSGLVDLLLERGLVHDSEPFATTALVLDEQPPAPVGAEARRVRTFEEFMAAVEVQREAFCVSAAEISQRRAELEDQWESSSMIMHAVWIDGRLVGAGHCAATPYGLALFGGATSKRAGTWRLPCTDPRPLAARARKGRPRAPHPGWGDVPADPRAPGFQADRLHSYACRRLRRVLYLTGAGVGESRIARLTPSGSSQFNRPSSFIVAGTSSARTSVASRKIAAASPTPNSCSPTNRPKPNPENAAIMMIAAAVMIRPVCWRPYATACSFSWVWSHSSRIRESRNTS